MVKQSFTYLVLFLGILFLPSDSMSAMGRGILRCETAGDVQEFLGSVLDEARAVNCWFSNLSRQEDSI